jgi:hypothetical protein
MRVAKTLSLAAISCMLSQHCRVLFGARCGRVCGRFRMVRRRRGAPPSAQLLPRGHELREVVFVEHADQIRDLAPQSDSETDDGR